LIGLSIDHVGEETARLIAEHFGSIEAIMKANVQEVADIHGIGEIVAESLVSWMHTKHNQETLRSLLKHVTLINPQRSTEGKLSGKTFVFTGTLPTLSRDEGKELARINGAHVAESVSSKTDFVVLGEGAGSKAKKAQELGIKILSEDEFKKMIQ
jgi:DNA ligase (NAD+)